MFDFFKKLNNQLMIGVLAGVVLLTVFSFYLFKNIQAISDINRETIIIYALPRVLSSIQITFHKERELISSLENGQISIEQFSSEFQTIEDREDNQFLQLDAILNNLNKAFYITPYWGQESKVMDGSVRLIHQKREELEIVLGNLAEANSKNDSIAQSATEEEALVLYDFFNQTTDALAKEADAAAERQAVYFKSTIDSALRLLVIFVLLILIIIGTVNVYVILFSSRSLSIILDGIKRFDSGDLAYRIPLKSQNEFGSIADALNTAINHIRESRKELEDAKNQLVHKISELEKFKRLTVAREMKMVELKKEMEKLKSVELLK